MGTAPLVFSEDYYARLGLERDAARDEVRRAYNALVRKFTPERSPDEFQRIRQAYETLNNSDTRREYDRKPAPAVDALLLRGKTAMDEKEYAAAEVAFKQLLVLQPDLLYVRNLLGLVFLHQGKHAEAIKQFTALTAGANEPVWYANLGHAFQLAGQYVNAAKAFQRAIDSADTEQASEYIEALVDCQLEQKAFVLAEETIQRRIKAGGTASFQDLRAFLKLVEVQIRAGKWEAVPATIGRIIALPHTEEEKRYAAYRIGLFGVQIAMAGVFSKAIPFADAACRLQPADEDYTALQRICSALERNAFNEARTILATKASFQSGGWLHSLGLKLQEWLAANGALKDLTPISSAPPLGSINGCGVRLYGHRDDDRATNSFVSTYFITFLFVPVIPLTAYRVVEVGSAYRFLGKAPLSPVTSAWRVIAPVLFAIYVISGDSSSGSRGQAAITPSSSTYSTSMPTASVPVSSSLLSPLAAEADWYGTGKADLEQQTAAVRRIDADLERRERDIETSKAMIDSEKAARSRSSGEVVDAMIQSHNRLVDEYNDLRRRRQGLYAKYKVTLDAFNERVERENSRARR
jgi:curved DNA-binding protein CbpA